ncbi:alpha/beta fold hydrolase [Nocardia sp. NPDC060256]|uniref:alpha/beta fold hydrolase n=1 Tax=unclassified Nocardia TaxID=2637762 RepID=UPI00365B671C
MVTPTVRTLGAAFSPHCKPAGRAAFAVDLPGFGLADPREPGPLTPQFDSFVDAIIAEHGPLTLVGNSLGAATALHAAARHPDEVTAVVSLDEPLLARHWLARVGRLREYRLFFRLVSLLPIPAALVRWGSGVRSHCSSTVPALSPTPNSSPPRYVRCPTWPPSPRAARTPRRQASRPERCSKPRWW